MLTDSSPVTEAPADKAARKFVQRLQMALQKYALENLPCNAKRGASVGVEVPVLAAADKQTPGFVADVALFDSARRAVRFAVTRDGNPSRPYYARALDKAGLGGQGLSGLDAAGQAGIILAVLQRSLGSVNVAVLVATCAPIMRPCTCKRACCSGKVINPQWRYALNLLCQESRGWLAAGSRWSYPLAEALLTKVYGGNQTYLDIANDLGLDQELVARHHKSFIVRLRGAKAKPNCEPVEGLEIVSWRDAESVLRDHNIVG